MSMTTQEFLTALWGNSPPGKVLIWTLPKKLSIWYDSFDTIDQDMQTHEHVDVYTGVGLAPGGGVRLTRKNRLTESQVAGIPGLWADIDVVHPVHAKSERLPPTRKQAIDAVNQLPFDPTILVNSGHGLQAWWLFEEGLALLLPGGERISPQDHPVVAPGPPGDIRRPRVDPGLHLRSGPRDAPAGHLEQ